MKTIINILHHAFIFHRSFIGKAINYIFNQLKKIEIPIQILSPILRDIIFKIHN